MHLEVGQWIRLVVIFLSFWAMWSLWVARRKRGHLWTSKLKDIWLALLLWTIACAEGNIELFYRKSQPSVAVFLVMGILLLTIKGVFNPVEKYTKNQPD